MDKNLFAKMSDNSIGNKTSSLEKDLDNVSVISDTSNISNISDLSNITVSSKDFFLKSDIRFKHFKQKPAFVRQIIHFKSFNLYFRQIPCKKNNFNFNCFY